jgi:hypothetical protein
MPLTHQDNGVSMGGTLREVSTLKKLLRFGGLKRPAKLIHATSQNILWSPVKVNEACVRPPHVT